MSKANNWGYNEDITKSYLRLKQTKVLRRKIKYFSYLSYDFWFQSSRGVYVKFLGGWDGLLLKSELKNKLELMWSAAVLRLINKTFLFQKIYCQEEGKTLTRSVLYVEELCSFQFSKRIICTGWVSPWLKSSGERASVSERMCSGPFGMSSGQGQEYKGLVFNLFLKYV